MGYTTGIAFPVPLLAGLAVIGGVSPLLTLAKLWQVKEWRWDRLAEHLGREGWASPFGQMRPLVLAIYVFCASLAPALLHWWLPGALLAFAALSAAQIGLRRQPMPVWTQKARILAAIALLLAIGLAVVLPAFTLPLVPLLQPLTLGIAWAAFWPVDRSMKRKIMAKAGALRSRFPDLAVIGVTGSVGKTTVKELLAHVLAPMHALATPAHVNTEMGVAQWMLRELPRYAQEHGGKGVLIVEMGAYRKGEIALMSSFVRQTVGVLTYIGTQHLALFGSQEALRDAKSEILTHLPGTGHAFLNGDNDLCRTVIPRVPCPVTVVGTGGSADLEAYEVEETRSGIAFTAQGTRYELPLHGTHNTVNVLLCIAVARHLGMEPRAIAQRLKTFIPPQRTFTVREERGVRILDDTHNSSAASIKAGITWAKSQPYAQKTLLMSGLIELGEAQERTERELGAAAAGIFQRAVFPTAKAAGAFAEGFGKPVETLDAPAERVRDGSLLVCAGRIPQSAIDRLLPKA